MIRIKIGRSITLLNKFNSLKRKEILFNKLCSNWFKVFFKI
ncbi:hypothetical protein THALO_360012 [Tenacibaculum halocynthiae]